MWPRGFRKKNPYTAEELSIGDCVRAARLILKARGSGEIIDIAPPDADMTTGPVHPPGGGVITDWTFHRAVRDGGRIYDLMTGPDGRTESEYALFFDDWPALIITVVEGE